MADRLTPASNVRFRCTPVLRSPELRASRTRLTRSRPAANETACKDEPKMSLVAIAGCHRRNWGTRGLQRIQLERLRHGVDAPYFLATAATLHAL
jgi:hypothetical protein